MFSPAAAREKCSSFGDRDKIREVSELHRSRLCALKIGASRPCVIITDAIATRSIAARRVGSGAGGTAVGAGIVGAFERAVGMQHHGAGMAHRVGVGLGQHLDVVAG